MKQQRSQKKQTTKRKICRFSATPEQIRRLFIARIYYLERGKDKEFLEIYNNSKKAGACLEKLREKARELKNESIKFGSTRTVN